MTVYERGILFDHRARVAAVEKAEAWTAAQAARLQTNCDFILEAIRERCWLPEQIEKVTSRYSLVGIPPTLTGVEGWVDAKIIRDRTAKARAASHPTAMAVALRKANDRAA